MVHHLLPLALTMLAWMDSLVAARTMHSTVGSGDQQANELPTDVQDALRELESMNALGPIESIPSHPAVRKLYVSDSSTVSYLCRIVATSANRNARLAAAFLLKHKNFPLGLLPLVYDQDPILRQYSRTLLNRTIIPGSSDEGVRVFQFEIDPTLSAALEPLPSAEVPLSPAEKARWISNLIRDASDPSRVIRVGGYDYWPGIPAFQGLAALPLDAAQSLTHEAAASPGNDDKLRMLLALARRLAERPFRAEDADRQQERKEFLRILRTILPSHDAATPLELRLETLRLELTLLTGTAFADLVRLYLRSGAPDVQRLAASYAIGRAELLLQEGGIDEATSLLAVARAYLSTEEDETVQENLRWWLERLISGFDEERRWLAAGVESTDDKGRVLGRIRVIKAGKSLVQVSEEEYRYILEQTGSPYLSDEQFRTLRVEFLDASHQVSSFQRRNASRQRANPSHDATVDDEKRRASQASAQHDPAERSKNVEMAFYILGGLMAILVVARILRRSSSTT